VLFESVLNNFKQSIIRRRIIFGGKPFDSKRFKKSESCVIIVYPFSKAYFHISVSFAGFGSSVLFT
jgi:hypothetical protein